jgi:hypothetical protein
MFRPAGPIMIGPGHHEKLDRLRLRFYTAGSQ